MMQGWTEELQLCMQDEQNGICACRVAEPAPVGCVCIVPCILVQDSCVQEWQHSSTWWHGQPQAGWGSMQEPAWLPAPDQELVSPHSGTFAPWATELKSCVISSDIKIYCSITDSERETLSARTSSFQRRKRKEEREIISWLRAERPIGGGVGKTIMLILTVRFARNHCLHWSFRWAWM